MNPRKLISACFLAAALTAANAQTLPQGVQKVTSIEGVDEFSFPNGLQVLLFPDSSKPKITVNVVYLVGSRNEGYGETGMAHLLEHMVFKSAKSGREIFKDLTDRTGGGNFNGTTSYDRTMYFETFNAGDDNLRWALGLEADRMVNMTMKGEDLATEMTVVRNEMENGENAPLNVLEERVLGAAYSFHNYGKTVIGNRTDVERVPIENLRVFYQKYYQPDNAILIVAGSVDESKTLGMVASTLGAIPKPTRKLTQPYTSEPTQEGERSLMLRRVGSTQGIIMAYHIPAALHPDMASLDVMAQVLGAPQTGRLYKALVDNKKAVSAGMYANDMHDPGYAMATVTLNPSQNIDEAREILLKTVEGLAAEPPSADEVERAKARLLKNRELAMTNSQQVGMMLANYAGDGDWRFFFLSRDEIAKVTPADVARVASAYLKSSNRTLGEFIPTNSPDRAVIPDTPDDTARFKDYKGGAAIAAGEDFDPTPANVEKRVIRRTLPNGLKLVMFPKKTRGGTVVASMSVEFGDEKSLMGKTQIGIMTGSLLMRGTKNKTRQQIQEETDRLKAQVNVSGGATGASANVRTLEANLADSLTLVRELLREPSFPEAELEQIRQQRITMLENQKTQPQGLAQRELNRHMAANYPPGDVRHVAGFDEAIEDWRKVSLDDVRKFHQQFYGVGEGQIVISGQFTPADVEKLVAGLFGDWKSPAHYQRIDTSYQKVEAMNQKIETPDKQNAVFTASMFTKMSDEAPDYPALTIAGMIFGGTPNSRVFERIRVKEGLSYGANADFSVPTKNDGARFFASAIAAPQNMPKLEIAFQDELAKALKDGFTADEVEKAKKAWLDDRAVSRAEEAGLAYELMDLEHWGRTMEWDAKLEAAVAALTPQQVNEAFRRHVSAAELSIVKAGDFQKVGAYK